MKKMYFLAALLMISLVSAQHQIEKPDYVAIGHAIGEKSSEQHFQKLMTRFTERDTTMTAENYRNLYFGFMLQDQYSPYGRSDRMDELDKYYKVDELDEKELRNARDLIEKILKDDPFNLNIIDMQSYVYEKSGNMAMSKKTSATLQKILEVIFMSGDGKTCDTAFHVQTVSHEYFLLNVLGVQSVGQSLIDNCDYLRFEKDKYKIAGLYFDISKMQERMMRELGGK